MLQTEIIIFLPSNLTDLFSPQLKMLSRATRKLRGLSNLCAPSPFSNQKNLQKKSQLLLPAFWSFPAISIPSLRITISCLDFCKHLLPLMLAWSPHSIHRWKEQVCLVWFTPLSKWILTTLRISPTLTSQDWFPSYQPSVIFSLHSSWHYEFSLN